MEEFLMKIYGVGKVECERLAELLREKNVTKWTEAKVRQMLRSPEIYNTLKNDTKIDLKYNPLRKIPRKLILIADKIIKKSDIKYDIAGSFRRGREFSGDIDVVIDKSTCAGFAEFRKKVKLNLLDPYAEGESYTRTLVKIQSFYVQIDLFFTEPNEYAACLLYTTGSKIFNITMRRKAKEMGLSLDQRGLWKGEKKMTFAEEIGYFEALSMKYLEPVDRNY